MLNFLLKLLLNYAKSEVVKEVVQIGAKKLVDSTDSSIDNELAKNLLGNIIESKGNVIKEDMTKVLFETLEEQICQ